MKLTSIIVDDDDLSINILKKLLIEYAFDSIDIVATSNNISEAETLINLHQPAVLFLDLQLDHGTSFDLLLKIRKYDYMAVFVTSYKDFIIESFKYNAVYYILKPISINDVVTSVNLVWKAHHLRNFVTQNQIQTLISNIGVKEPENDYLEILAVPGIGSTALISHKNIIFCKSDGRYTEIHLDSGEVMVSAKNLGKYEELLPYNTFFRIHKTYIVNLNKISTISKVDGNYVQLTNGVKLPVSSRKATSLSKVLRISI